MEQLEELNEGVSYVGQLRAQYAYNRKQALWLTGMSEADMDYFQNSLMMEWLRQYTTAPQEQLELLYNDTLIWKWWKNEWNRRDNDFVIECLYEFIPDVRLTRYRQYHQLVFCETSCPYDLLDKSFAKAMEDFNKKIREKYQLK